MKAKSFGKIPVPTPGTPVPVTTDANLRRPWIHLLRWVPDFTWQATYLGTGYIGSGTVR